VQGLFMLGIAVFVVGAFLAAMGVDGGTGPSAVNAALPAEMRWDVHTDPSVPTFSSWWVLVLLLIAHFGFVTQPHLGNKFFAMRGGAQTRQFILFSSIAGLTVGFLFLGGVLGRAIGIEVDSPDQIMPAMFMELLPAWAAAALAIAILSAIISTADGLLMSISQIFANDLYRKTWIPWRGKDPNDPECSLAAFTMPGMAPAVWGMIESDLAEEGVTDYTASYGERLIQMERCDYLKPMVVHAASPEKQVAKKEYMFPFVTVVECPQEQMLAKIGPTLVASAIAASRGTAQTDVACQFAFPISIMSLPSNRRIYRHLQSRSCRFTCGRRRWPA
jgi:hypothetical protein